MKILIVNTSERIGGAAVAANRLMNALNNCGVKAKMLVRDKQTEDIRVAELPRSVMHRWHFLWERWCIFLRLKFSKKHLFDIDIANAGTDITRLPEFKWADVVHLSWINQGMLSLRGIRKIIDSGKPVVWTMHDMWEATAICHLTKDCENFKIHCKKCIYLPDNGGENDLSSRVWQRKKKVYSRADIHFVACSRWLAEQAKSSKLIEGHPVHSIPNAIDTRVFFRKEKTEAAQRVGLPHDKQLILFAAQRVTNENKGIKYLIEACRLLAERHPQLKTSIGIVILGGNAEELATQFCFPAFPLGYVGDEQTLADVYNAVDVFVLPSLSENLPNTIMESMACGTPCVGFNVGGIPEEIDHRRNGYVAAYKDFDDLERGIYWVLKEANYTELSNLAVKKVARNYTPQAVALQYVEVYNQALAFKKCKL